MRPFDKSLLLLPLALAACERAPELIDPAGTALASAAERPQEERIGEGVLEAIQKNGSAAVVVALEVPGHNGLGELRRNVAAAQDDVLRGNSDHELHVRRRYQAVPAFAGTARSEMALKRLASHPRVKRIDLDVDGTGELGTSVAVIGANQRRDVGNDGEGVRVAVLDTGIDTDHPDLAGAAVHQACFGDRDFFGTGSGFCANGLERMTGEGAAEDDAGHGTHVSGIITGNGAVGAPGVAPGADIVAIKVLDNCSFAGCFYGFSEIVAALDYIIANNATLGVQVINMSLGTSLMFAGACDNTTAYNMAGAAAINTLRSMGVVAFSSTGNRSSGLGMGSPACLSNVVSVGATDNLDNVALFSNSNAQTDIFAPGVRITSAFRGGGLVIASGTSMASPHAAGCAALLIDAGRFTTPAAVETRLKTSPVRVTDPKNGRSFPRIDCSLDPNAAPVVSIGGPYAGLEGRSLALAGASVTDPDVDALMLRWSVESPLCTIDDPTAAAPSLTCADDGAFTVTLEAFDRRDVASASTTVQVSNLDPVISAFTVAPSTIVVGQSVAASGAFADVPADALSARVHWADGDSEAAGSPVDAAHTYRRSGAYAVRLDVSDEDGGSASATHTVTVLSPADAVDALRERLDRVGLANQEEHPFHAQLRAARHSAARGDAEAALGQLAAFQQHVAAQRGKAIGDDDADALVAAAQVIIDALRAGLS
jgi:subtilisin family serine protease